MKRQAHRFLRDRHGNFAMLAALLAVPLALSAGLALDYSAISRARSDLQHAADAAALAVVREGQTLSNAEAWRIAQDYLGENFRAQYAKFSVARAGTGVEVSADAVVPLTFGGLFGKSEWPVRVASTADIALNSYEIALVLDTTGSMAGGKLASLKDAVLGLIEITTAQTPDPERLRIAMVPFANFVNVGPEHGPKFDKKGKMVKNSGAEWLDLNGKNPIPQLELVDGVSRFELFHHLKQDWAGCVETRPPTKKNAHDVADTPARKKDPDSLFVPAFSIDEPDQGDYTNNYIASAVDPLDKSPSGKIKKLKKYGATDTLVGKVLGVLGGVVAPLGPDSPDWNEIQTNASSNRGPNAGCVTQPLTPLTTDYAGLQAKVKTLQANGTTNILEGVAWGHRVLSPGEPFGQGAAPDKGLEKVMIVLTDGANVFGNKNNALRSSYGSYGYLVDGRLGPTAASSSATNDLMNKKTLAACTEAKAQGIIVYTIRLEEPDGATGAMLKECASSPAHFFDAPSRSQLDEVFESIASRIIRVRLAS